MIIKLEADSRDPLDLSFILKEGNKKHNFKLYGASVISATEVVTDNNNWPYTACPHRQEITFNCDYFEMLNDNDDNNKEEKLKEQKNDNDDEEITW